MRRIQLRITPQMIIQNLAVDLYSPGQAAMEIIRNGVAASQPDHDTWNPKLATIEVTISKNHPFIGGPATVFLDHGCGMTEPALERYFGWLGTPTHLQREFSTGTHMGASQKGIGRYAGLFCNKNCRPSNPDASKEGFYLFSRTMSTGPIRLIHVTPGAIAVENGIEVDHFVDPDSTEARFLGGIRGSFTAIVIPSPVFDTADDIYGHIKWLLPREKDKMFNLTVNGKKIEPPPLWDDVNATEENGIFRARIGAGNKECDGIWFCDAETGFRVASCVKLGRLLPEPLGYPDLAGDIFAPGLLRYQNTARDSLSRDYTRRGNPEWLRLLSFLNLRVAPKALELIERDELEEDTIETLGELVSLINDTFGEPEPVSLPPGPVITTPIVRPTGGTGTKKPGTPGERRPRGASITVGSKVYRLHYNAPLGSLFFATPAGIDRNIILINAKGTYQLPKVKQARREHCLMQILFAVGEVEGFGSAHESMKFANEMRGVILKKRKGG
ncbi:MAG TPA: hypothetical protein VFT82_03805 [Candidatus Paceibacterota bacterium]|nr:hypothetical protein [Candidatus Paceibacterota bacterium]